jgi:GTPase Era involved in 16S rRNA processing
MTKEETQLVFLDTPGLNTEANAQKFKLSPALMAGWVNIR